MEKKRPPEEDDELAIVRRLEKEGVVSRAPGAKRVFKPIAKRPGAFKRFLEERD